MQTRRTSNSEISACLCLPSGGDQRCVPTNPAWVGHYHSNRNGTVIEGKPCKLLWGPEGGLDQGYAEGGCGCSQRNGLVRSSLWPLYPPHPFDTLEETGQRGAQQGGFRCHVNSVLTCLGPEGWAPGRSCSYPPQGTEQGWHLSQGALTGSCQLFLCWFCFL